MYKILVQPGNIDPCAVIDELIADRVLLPGDIIALSGYRYFEVLPSKPGSDFPVCVKMLFNNDRMNEVAKPFGLQYLFSGGLAFVKIASFPDDDDEAGQIETFLTTGPVSVLYSPSVA